jgi:hypothetical protein
MLTLLIFLNLIGIGRLLERKNQHLLFSTHASQKKNLRSSSRLQSLAQNGWSQFMAVFIKPVLPGQNLFYWARDMARQSEGWNARRLPAETISFVLWLNSLPQPQVDRFEQELDVFCRSLGLELAWFLDPLAWSGSSDPANALIPSIQDVVALYALSVQRGQSLQALVVLHNWQPQDHELTGAIYTRLSEAGLVSTPGLLMWASEEQRYAHMTQSIQTASVQQRAGLLALLDELLAEGQIRSQAVHLASARSSVLTTC